MVVTVGYKTTFINPNDLTVNKMSKTKSKLFRKGRYCGLLGSPDKFIRTNSLIKMTYYQTEPVDVWDELMIKRLD